MAGRGILSLRIGCGLLLVYATLALADDVWLAFVGVGTVHMLLANMSGVAHFVSPAFLLRPVLAGARAWRSRALVVGWALASLGSILVLHSMVAVWLWRAGLISEIDGFMAPLSYGAQDRVVAGLMGAELAGWCVLSAMSLRLRRWAGLRWSAAFLCAVSLASCLGPATLIIEPFVPNQVALKIFDVWFWVVYAVLPAQILATVVLLTKGELILRGPPKDTDCARCGYDLRGQREPGCPECGWGRGEECTKARSETTLESAHLTSRRVELPSDRSRASASPHAR